MTKKAFWGLFVFSLVFCFIGCDNGNTPAGEELTTPLITGKFSSQTGSGDAVFYADYASNSRSISRAVGGMAATEKELTGKIEDGDVVFNLKGIYNTSNNQFFLSAGSSFLIYDIAGTLSGGSISATEATVKVKSNDDWTIHKIAVAAASDTAIAGSVSGEQESGFPSTWFGEWDVSAGNEFLNKFLLTSFQIVSPDMPELIVSLLYFETITEGEEYLTIYEQSVDGAEGEFYVVKFKAEGSNLILSSSSDYSTYADAIATIDSPDFLEEQMILRRPN